MAGMTPNEGGVFSSNTTNSAFKKQLNKVYTWYTGGFIAFVCVLVSVVCVPHSSEQVALGCRTP